MNGKQRAEEYARRVRVWISDRDNLGDYAEYERNGKINRGALCDELDFGRSVLTQNPIVKSALAEAESRWFVVEKTNVDAIDAARERADKRAAMRGSDVSRLEDELAKLRVENSMLKKRLEKFEALDEVIKSTGMAPRL